MNDQYKSQGFGAWQFSTRTLLSVVTACAVLLLVFQTVGPMWSMLIVWFLILGAAHVVANAFGSHQIADSARRTAAENATTSRRPGEVVRCAPATQLRDRRGFGRALIAIVAVSAVLGWLLGTAGLLFLTPANLAGIALGGASAAILGGFLGFVAGSFVMVATRSFREASDTPSVKPIKAS